MATKQATVLLYLAPETRDELRSLAKRLRILQSVLLREAVDDLLLKHAAKPPKGKEVRAK
jgi:hypothetical protein